MRVRARVYNSGLRPKEVQPSWVQHQFSQADTLTQCPVHCVVGNMVVRRESKDVVGHMEALNVAAIVHNNTCVPHADQVAFLSHVTHYALCTMHYAKRTRHMCASRAKRYCEETL